MRVDGGWQRCECLQPLFTAAYVKEAIRGAETVLPEQFKGQPPLSWGDQRLLGDRPFAQIRYRVWGSLEHYAPLEPTYDCVDLSRLPSIFFGEGDHYESPQELIDLDLLILAAGQFYIPNKTFPALVGQLLDQRRLHGRPTWAISEFNSNRLRSIYPPAVVDLLDALGAAPPTRPASVPVALLSEERAVPVQPAATSTPPVAPSTPLAGPRSNKDRPKRTEHVPSDRFKKQQHKKAWGRQ